ncbi:MAG: NifU N-terminal domain-containing protein [Phycisphaeraceae bacterium]|nr:NifU N-terminal domain-containing protein [Phycisphaeraceae bacterium]
MSFTVTAFEPTPNPNAIKCVVSPAPTEEPRSYFRAEQAAGDPLAAALFAIPGVTNVLVHRSFITVGKAGDAAWGPIKTGVKRVLRGQG